MYVIKRDFGIGPMYLMGVRYWNGKRTQGSIWTPNPTQAMYFYDSSNLGNVTSVYGGIVVCI